MRPLLLLLGLLGSTPSAAAPPERIAVISAPVAEILFALGVGERIVALRGYVDHIPGAERVPRMRDGGPVLRSAEPVLAFRPQALWFSEGQVQPEVLAQLRAVGLALRAFPERFDEDALLATVAELGAEFGKREEAEAVAAQFRAEMEAIRRLPRLDPPPRALFVLAGGNRPQLIAGRDSLFTALIEMAGGLHPAEHEGYKLLSPEALIKLAPEIIFVIGEAIGPDGLPIVFSLPGMGQTPAGRARRFGIIGGHCLGHVGLSWPACVRAVRAALVGQG